MKHENVQETPLWRYFCSTSYDFWFRIHGSSLATQLQTTIDPDISNLTEVSLGKTEVSLPQELVKM